MERTDIEQWRGKEVARLLALVETERRYYQEMVASLPVALAVLSSDRSIISANRAFRSYFGLRPEEFRRRQVEHILPSTTLLESIRAAHISNLPQEGFYIAREERLYHVNVLVMRNWDDESELETLLAIYDVTDVPHLEPKKHPPAQEPPVAPPVQEPPAPQPPVEEPPAEEPPATEPPPVETPSEDSTPQETVEPLAEIPPQPETETPTADEPVAAEIETEIVVVVEPVEVIPAVDTATLPAIVWRASAAFEFSAVSGATERISGFTSDHWLTTPEFFIERIAEIDRVATMEHYRTALAKGEEASAEFRMISASGAPILCRETIYMVEPGTIAGIVMPIGQRHTLEQQHVTSQRHAALQSLSAKLAHDLNNPLMIITGYAEELMHSFAPNDPRRGDLQQILNATARMNGVTSSLLTLTRPVESAIESLDLAASITNLRRSIERRVGGIDKLYLAAEQPVWVTADRIQLEEVILTLVGAVTPAPGSGHRVAVSCELAPITERMDNAPLAPGMYAALIVRNDGPALETPARATAFESILGDDSGLVRAYSLVRSWGGDIHLTSDDANGTIFTLYLPLTEPVEPALAPETPAETPAEEQAATVKTILVVDDEPGIRALVAKILRRENYNVIEAGSAAEAIRAATSQDMPIDMLLTDVMLPDQNGREVAEQLRAQLPSLKVLYISGFTDDQAVRAGELPTGARFLQKPFTVGALVGRVRETLES